MPFDSVLTALFFLATIAQANARISETELQILQIGQDLRSEVAKELGEVQGKIAELVEKLKNEAGVI